MKAVFLDYDTVSNGDLDTTALSAAVDDLALCASDDANTAERIRDVEIVLLNKVELSRELLQGAPKLKLIAVAGTGTNNIDVAAARELGVGVCNVRGYCTSSVVQHVWGLILSLTQHVSDHVRLVGSGSWNHDELPTVFSHPIRELDGRVFGVVGWGELGRGAARVAEHLADLESHLASKGACALRNVACLLDLVLDHPDQTPGLVIVRARFIAPASASASPATRHVKNNLYSGHAIGQDSRLLWMKLREVIRCSV